MKRDLKRRLTLALWAEALMDAYPCRLTERAFMWAAGRLKRWVYESTVVRASVVRPERLSWAVFVSSERASSAPLHYIYWAKTTAGD